MKTSGLLIIRNGVECGYTFQEALLTLDAVCDEIIVCEGYSTDSTFDEIESLKNPKIKIFRDAWERCADGSEFARVTNLGLRRCTGDYIFYLQADELVHENDLPGLREAIASGQYNSISFGFVHLRYDFGSQIANDVYTRAIRVIRNIPEIVSIQDGFDFGGGITPGLASQWVIYHAGYVFLANILAKMINHYQEFYVTQATYRQRHDIAVDLLRRLENGERVSTDEAHRLLEPHYHLSAHGRDLPYLFAPHVGKAKYDPAAFRSLSWPIPQP